MIYLLSLPCVPFKGFYFHDTTSFVVLSAKPFVCCYRACLLKRVLNCIMQISLPMLKRLFEWPLSRFLVIELD